MLLSCRVKQLRLENHLEPTRQLSHYEGRPYYVEARFLTKRVLDVISREAVIDATLLMTTRPDPAPHRKLTKRAQNRMSCRTGREESVKGGNIHKPSEQMKINSRSKWSQ